MGLIRQTVPSMVASYICGARFFDDVAGIDGQIFLRNPLASWPVTEVCVSVPMRVRAASVTWI